MDKLAEEILDKYRSEKRSLNEVGMIELMQSYHEVKLKEELIRYTASLHDLDEQDEWWQKQYEKMVDDYLKQRNNGTIS